MVKRSGRSEIDDYIAGFPTESSKVIEDLRQVIKAAAPAAATETMSYGIPTFDLDGKHLVHYAGAKNHVGFYPTPSAVEAFKEELAPYRSAKGSVQFPLGEPLPEDLIRRMVAFRVEEVVG